jgi:hypothetical protein
MINTTYFIPKFIVKFEYCHKFGVLYAIYEILSTMSSCGYSKKYYTSEFKFYSHDLINNLFKYPYTKIEFLEQDLKIHRNTAAAYLNQLYDRGLLGKVKLGRSNYYLNEPLFNLLKG